MTDSENEDWRLEAVIDKKPHGDVLDRVIEDTRNGKDGRRLGDDIVLTHADDRIFAYAPDRTALDSVRGALEAALAGHELVASISLSRWDESLDLWRRVEPAPSAEEEASFAAAEREADRPTTRTLVASAGHLIKEQFERTMLDEAERLGLECKIVEHRHLLTTQVAFTVSGPGHAVSQFERGLRAEGRTTVRAQEEVGFSL